MPATDSARLASNLQPRITPPPESCRKPKLLDRLREALRSRHYSRRTDQTYCHWVKRFIFFQGLLPNEWVKMSV